MEQFLSQTITEESQTSTLQVQAQQLLQQIKLKNKESKTGTKLQKLTRPFSYDMLRSKDLTMPGTKISMNSYFFSLPRCAICNEVGYSPTAKFKKYQRKEHGSKLEQKVSHASELNYLLFDCSECGLMVHPQCYGNTFLFPQKLTTENQNLEIERVHWKCQDCLVKRENVLEESSQTQIENQYKSCSICYQHYQTQEVFKNMKTQGQRAHLFCAMWYQKATAADLCNFNMIQISSKINDSEIAIGGDKTCQVCKQDFGYMTQCYQPSCSEHFHPICGKNDHHYFEIVKFGLQVCCAFFCKTHSLPFIQNKIDNWRPRQSNKDN